MKKHLSVKQIVGCILLILGIILVIFSLYERNRIKQIKEEVHEDSCLVPDSSFKSKVQYSVDQKMAQYDAPVMWCLVGGVVLVIVGIGCCCKKHKAKK